MLRSRAPLLIYAAVLCVYAALYGFGYSTFINRSLWVDEVFSIGVTVQDWPSQIRYLLLDVHPPLYPLFLNAVQIVTPSLDPVVSGRLANLVFVPVILAALVVVRRARGAAAALILAGLILANESTAYYSLEVRFYFGLMSCTLLMTVLLIFGRGATADRVAIATAHVLALAHFFGTAMALASLAWHTIRAWQARDFVRMKRLLLGGYSVFLLFAIWMALTYRTVVNINRHGFWIDLNWDLFEAFYARNQFAMHMLVVAGLSLAVTGGWRKPEVRDCLVPAGTVLIGTIGISLWQPILTDRNLLVLLPHIALVGMIGIAALPRPALVAAALALVSLAWAPRVYQGFAPAENVDWLADRAFGPECADVPLAVDKPEYWHWSLLPPAFDVPRRPPVTMAAMTDLLRRQPELFENCRVIAAGFRKPFSPGWSADAIKSFRAAGFPVERQQFDTPGKDEPAEHVIVLTSGDWALRTAPKTRANSGCRASFVCRVEKALLGLSPPCHAGSSRK